MQQYDKHTRKVSRTYGKDSHVSRQPSVETILRHYCSSTSVQRQAGRVQPLQRVKAGENEVDLNTVPFPVLAWLQGQCIRIRVRENVLSLPREERFKGTVYIINPADIEQIAAVYERRKVTEDAVLYEGMQETKGRDAKIIYPGLNSCIGITVTNTQTYVKTGAHFVIPCGVDAFEIYRSNLASLYRYYQGVSDDFCRITISSSRDTTIADHIHQFQEILDSGMYVEYYGVDADTVVEVISQLTGLSRASFFIRDERDGGTGAEYGTEYVHVIKTDGTPDVTSAS